MNIIITHSDKGELLSQKIVKLGFKSETKRVCDNIKELWEKADNIIFIGALGICVRVISHFLKDKNTDPAVVNIDANGHFVQAVTGGHVGGANKLAKEIALLIGATPVITTVSDTSDLWALDVLPRRFNWKLEYAGNLTQQIANFVNGKKTALLLEVRHKGTLYLENTLPAHVQVFYSVKDIHINDFDLIIAVTPFIYDFGDKAIFYRPAAIHLGTGSQKELKTEGLYEKVKHELGLKGISYLSIASVNTIDLKEDEKALKELSKKLNVPFNPYPAQTLAAYTTPNPSEKVEKVTGSAGVAEAAAMHSSANSLLIEKIKIKHIDKYLTISAAIDYATERTGYIEFVGAGPGDPELISVKGKKILQNADYILYAGSLVPKELTTYAKQGCVVESSAGMDLMQQIEKMQYFYKRHLLVARLHTGDPCIYGAIQEQMTELDKREMKYSITPGISSFQAAAAALKSQFTIPEEVQTIILTRGEGRTPMPEREKLNKLAASQSTMCIYLSAAMVDKVQEDLLVHYTADTPAAVCYKLTWKDEKIFRCILGELAKTVKENNLTMTTLMVVGKAIDNRSGLSKLYHKEFSHAFRNNKIF